MLRWLFGIVEASWQFVLEWAVAVFAIALVLRGVRFLARNQQARERIAYSVFAVWAGFLVWLFAPIVWHFFFADGLGAAFRGAMRGVAEVVALLFWHEAATTGAVVLGGGAIVRAANFREQGFEPLSSLTSDWRLTGVAVALGLCLTAQRAYGSETGGVFVLIYFAAWWLTAWVMGMSAIEGLFDAVDRERNRGSLPSTTVRGDGRRRI